MDKLSAIMCGDWKERYWRAEEGQPRAASMNGMLRLEQEQKYQSKDRENAMAILKPQLQ